jgi:fructose-1,6-bisphosphatase
MSSDHAEVRAILSALVCKVQSCKEDLNAQELGNALYGLQGMGFEGDSKLLLDVLLIQSDKLAGSTSKCQAVSCANQISLRQDLRVTLLARGLKR